MLRNKGGNFHNKIILCHDDHTCILYVPLGFSNISTSSNAFSISNIVTVDKTDVATSQNYPDYHINNKILINDGDDRKLLNIVTSCSKIYSD